MWILLASLITLCLFVCLFCPPSGNLVIEKMPPSVHPPNVIVGQVSPGHGHGAKHPGQINLAQLRLQHMQQAAYAQKQQQQQHQHQQQQQIQQQMRIASQMVQHPRQGGPQMVQQQVYMLSLYSTDCTDCCFISCNISHLLSVPPEMTKCVSDALRSHLFQPPRLISMPSLQRGGVNGSSHMFPSHSLRIGPGQGRMQPGQPPRHNGQQYPMMQPQLQRQVGAQCFDYITHDTVSAIVLHNCYISVIVLLKQHIHNINEYILTHNRQSYRVFGISKLNETFINYKSSVSPGIS